MNSKLVPDEIGHAVAREYGADPATPLGGMISTLARTEIVDKEIQWDLFPFQSQITLDFWRMELRETVSSFSSMLGDVPGVVYMRETIEAKIARILAAFNGEEPDPKLHELSKQKHYGDRLMDAVIENAKKGNPDHGSE